ncbi:hypothetical protein Tco_0698097 [Tanacetum coccineum]
MLSSQESKKQTILEEIKRKAPGKGLGAAPESPDHSNSSDDSFEYTNDDKTESESDSEHGDKNDKSVNEDKSVDLENDDSNKDSCNDKDQIADFVIHPETQIHSLGVTTTSTEDFTSVANGDLDHKPSQYRRSHDDQDLPKDHKGETRNIRVQETDEPRQEEEQEHDKQSDVPSNLNPIWFQKTVKELPEQSLFNKLVDAEEEPEENELQNCPAFELSKGRFKNSVELQYNLEQCHLALTDKIDWANPEGYRFHDDLSQPLPLVGPPGIKTIPISYCYNHDLEYLMHRNEEKKYALSASKIKATRYKDEGIE